MPDRSPNRTAEDAQASAAVESAIMDLVKEVVPRRLHGKIRIEENTVLTDLGINSMAKISLAFRIEQTLGIDLSSLGGAVAEVRTVKDVIDLLRQALASGEGSRRHG